jgi:hypothetical protein
MSRRASDELRRRVASSSAGCKKLVQKIKEMSSKQDAGETTAGTRRVSVKGIKRSGVSDQVGRVEGLVLDIIFSLQGRARPLALAAQLLAALLSSGLSLSVARSKKQSLLRQWGSQTEGRQRRRLPQRHEGGVYRRRVPHRCPKASRRPLRM